MKYHSKKATCANGHTHDSKKEAKRCNELHLMQRAGRISELKIQVPFELIPPLKFKTMRSERACKYVADFTYICDGVQIIEDTKGYKTPDYIIKRKLMKQRYCEDGEVRFIET